METLEREKDPLTNRVTKPTGDSGAVTAVPVGWRLRRSQAAAATAQGFGERSRSVEEVGSRRITVDESTATVRPARHPTPHWSVSHLKLAVQLSAAVWINATRRGERFAEFGGFEHEQRSGGGRVLMYST